MTNALRISLALAACAYGQSGLNRPQLGTMLDSAGAARAVFGLPGSLSVADPALSGVVSLGCAAFCLFKTDSSLIAADGSSAAAPAGPALFAFDSTGAFVYFPQSHELARWQAGQLSPLPINIAGEILAMRSMNGAPQFAVRIGGAIRIVSDGNAVVDSLPGMATAVMLLPSSTLYATGEGLVLRRADASEITFPLAGANSFTAMSGDYVEMRARGATYALRVTPGREQLFVLPEPGQ